jgi:hypothetical protein
MLMQLCQCSDSFQLPWFWLHHSDQYRE